MAGERSFVVPRPLKVVYLCEFPTLLGGERSLLTFLQHRDTARVEPIVVAPEEGRLAEALDVLELPRVCWPAQGRRAIEPLARVLESYHPDLVHANSLMMADVAIELGRRLQVPAVTHVRDIMNLSAARRDRLNELAAVIAVSDAVADWLREIGVSNERIKRVYNAVDVGAMQAAAMPGALRWELGIDDSVPLVGCIGQIALRKGQDFFLAAAKTVAHRVPDAQFLVVGQRYSQKEESRAFEVDLHARSSTPPLTGRTHFLGYRDDVPSILADLSVLVVPSRQEPLSRVLLEGLAMGVAAVATQVGGSAEILDGGKAGLLVPPDDPKAMAEAAVRLLSEEALRQSLANRGMRRVEKQFTPTAQVGTICQLYDSLIG